MLSLNYILAQIDTSPLPGPVEASKDVFPKVINIALGILGAIAVLIIVVAGLRYITSRGDPQTITKSKDTIMYAIIGLV